MVEQIDTRHSSSSGGSGANTQSSDTRTSISNNPRRRPNLPQRPTNYPDSLNQCMFACMLGLFQHGYQAHVLNMIWYTMDHWLDEWYWLNRGGKRIDPNLKAFMIASFRGTYSIGGLIGAYYALKMINTHRIRQSLLFSSLGAVTAYVFMSSANLFRFLSFIYAGRIAISIHCGIQSVLIPLYMIEISRRDTRATVFAMCIPAYSFGFAISQTLGQQTLLGGQANWDYLLCVPVVTLVIQMFMLKNYSSDCPRDLFLNAEDEEEARQVMEKLCFRRPIIEEELNEMREEKRQIHEDRYYIGPVTSIIQVLRAKGLSKQLMLGCAIQVIQQFCGFNNLLFSSTEILERRELVKHSANGSTVTMGIIFFLMSLFSIKLINCFSRRFLYLTGLMVMLLSSLLITLAFMTTGPTKYILCQICLNLYAFGYVVGPMIITPLFTAEIFTQPARPAALSFCMMIHWLCNLISTMSIPLLENLIGKYLFVPNSIMIILSICYLYYYLPETKDLTFAMIVEKIRNPGNRDIEMQEVNLP